MPPEKERLQSGSELVQGKLDLHATAYTLDGQVIPETNIPMIQKSLPFLFDENDDVSDETPTEKYFNGDY